MNILIESNILGKRRRSTRYKRNMLEILHRQSAEATESGSLLLSRRVHPQGEVQEVPCTDQLYVHQLVPRMASGSFGVCGHEVLGGAA